MTYFAIRTAPQRETAVEAALRVKGYDVVLPLEGIRRRAKRGSGPRTILWKPMFTRYCFIRGPVPWLHLMAERHVTGVVGFNGAPSPIADCEIDRLRAMSGFMRPDVSVNKQRAVKTGDMAKISSGPFTGHVVKVTGLSAKKARVFQRLFGSERSVELPVDMLERVA